MRLIDADLLKQKIHEEMEFFYKVINVQYSDDTRRSCAQYEIVMAQVKKLIDKCPTVEVDTRNAQEKWLNGDGMV